MMTEPFLELFDLGKSKGKTARAILQSQQNYNSIIALYGGAELIPSSVMKAKRTSGVMLHDKIGTERSYKSSESEKFKKNPKGLRTSSITVSGKGANAGALSIFPQEIGRSIVLFYSQPGDTVVDPFAGHNSRMELCVRAGRNYTGCDLSKTFMKENVKRAAFLRSQFPKAAINLHHTDSRSMPVDNEVGDFIITSPPYWDIEYYGDEPQQLGKTKTYKQFLDGLQKVMNENFRVLKPGKFAAWFVNDFRKDGRFYLYHMDTIQLAINAGFIPHDLLVVDFGRGFRDVFPSQIVKSQIIPKRHEYGLIFKKP